LKAAFRTLAEEGYQNFEIIYSHGAPTAYFYDENDQQVSTLMLQDMSLGELIAKLEENGLKLKAANLPELPTGGPEKELDLGGVHYEFYSNKVRFEQAKSFADSKTNNGNKGRLLTLGCSNQEAKLQEWLGPNEDLIAWLGANDDRQESVWSWTESGKVFYDHAPHAGEYNNWVQSEPNDADNNEDCVVLKKSGWNDVNCLREVASIVVEYGPLDSLECPGTPGVQTEL